MVRWEPNAADRLAQAAMELYSEHGYEQTTVAEIAARAGLTERTFFRHFADKREVLFQRSSELQDLMLEALAAAPPDTSPLAAVALAVEEAGAFLQQGRARSLQRQVVIAANTELQERELIKMARLATALAGSLRERGVPGPTADMAAEAGIAVFRLAFETWASTDEAPDLTRVMRDAFAGLRALTS